LKRKKKIQLKEREKNNRKREKRIKKKCLEKGRVPIIGFPVFYAC